MNVKRCYLILGLILLSNPLVSFADVDTFTASEPFVETHWADYTISPQGSGTNYYYAVFPPGWTESLPIYDYGEWCGAIKVKEGASYVTGDQWLGSTGEYNMDSGSWFDQGKGDCDNFWTQTGFWYLVKINGDGNYVADWSIQHTGFSSEEETSSTTGATTTEAILVNGFISLIFGISLILFLLMLFVSGYIYNNLIKPLYER